MPKGLSCLLSHPRVVVSSERYGSTDDVTSRFSSLSSSVPPRNDSDNSKSIPTNSVGNGRPLVALPSLLCCALSFCSALVHPSTVGACHLPLDACPTTHLHKTILLHSFALINTQTTAAISFLPHCQHQNHASQQSSPCCPSPIRRLSPRHRQSQDNRCSSRGHLLRRRCEPVPCLSRNRRRFP